MLANRLTEDADKRVLLLEAGGSENILSDIPIAAATLQMTPIDWAYQTEPQEAACFGLINRRSHWPRGRVLGGSSVLNYMLYIRGNKRDYNRWEAEGATGWSWADVFPYFLKSEDNRDESVVANGKLCQIQWPSFEGEAPLSLAPLPGTHSDWIRQLFLFHSIHLCFSLSPITLARPIHLPARRCALVVMR